MCYRLLRIVNNKIDFDPNKDKVYLSVPCGKCAECQNQKVKSWSIRNYYEFLNTKNHNGIVFNYTLTYNDENLPHYLGFPTFDKTHVQKFLKLLRKWLVKDGYIHDGGLRYFLTSEFGKLHQRPHYHIILYLDSYIFPDTMTNYVRKFWKYGFIGYGKLGAEVRDFHALTYACKYITKDQYYLKIEDSCKTKYLQIHQEHSETEFNEVFKNFRSFHLQSKHFGECMLKYVHDKELFIGRIFNPFTSTGTLPIPMYIIRKVFYDTVKQEDGSYRYVLNNKGVFRKVVKINENIENDLRQLEIFRHTSDNDFLLSALSKIQPFNSVNHFFEWFDRVFEIKNFPVYTLFVYKHIYKDRVYNDFTDFHNDKLKFAYGLNSNLTFTKDESKSHLYNFKWVFHNFDLCLSYLEIFKQFHSYLSQKKSIDEYNIKQSQIAFERHSIPIYIEQPNILDFLDL